jgi:hypothetical protein
MSMPVSNRFLIGRRNTVLVEELLRSEELRLAFRELGEQRRDV